MDNKIKNSKLGHQLNLFENEIEIKKVDNDYYQFKPNKTIFIPNTPSDIDAECHCLDEIWTFPVNGMITKIDWSKFKISKPLIELLKGFIFKRLQTRATSTVLTDINFVKSIDNNPELHSVDWDLQNVINLLSLLNRQTFYSFKEFYRWCVQRQFNNFTDAIYKVICEFKTPKYDSYSKVYLRQFGHIDQKVSKLIVSLDEEKKELTDSLSLRQFIEVQNRAIIRLCLELAPRPSQIYFLNHSDLSVLAGEQSIYYSISLPMAKKTSEKVKERRTRAISSLLGRDIELLVKANKDWFKSNNDMALFRSPKEGNRYSAYSIGALIRNALEFVNLNATELRHNLAQSLADQGASADVIADILGHNSTLPARAYIAATPKISEIKSKALGKNNNYRNIMQMLNTGEIISKKDVQKDTWVKGVVGFQYIGEIGACGLNSPCPKNPVYSCYTCKKFNPFNDGKHADVLKGLESSVQLFLDASTNKKDIQHNRTVVQLEATIIAVKGVINLINSKNENRI